MLTLNYLYSPIGILSDLEPSLGIIAGCIATLRPLLKHLGIVIDSAQRSGATDENSATLVTIGGRKGRGWVLSRTRELDSINKSAGGSQVELTITPRPVDDDQKTNRSITDV